MRMVRIPLVNWRLSRSGLRTWPGQALLIGLLASVPASLTFVYQRSAIVAWLRIEPTPVSFKTARSWPGIVWVDARSAAQYAAGHIGGAVSLNEDRWDALFGVFLDEWTAERRIVVYCNPGKCDESRAVARRLRKNLGAKEIYFLAEGWRPGTGQ